MNFQSLDKLITLLEMPQEVKISLSIDQPVDYIRSNTKYVQQTKLNGKAFEIREYNNGSDVELYFINDNIVAAEVGYYLRGSGIEENLIIQNPLYRGLARSIYTDYLLKRFSYILSDSTMTIQGFSFWKKLYKNY
jgi:hypothetical protein